MNLSKGRKRAIEELNLGREFANQLEQILAQRCYSNSGDIDGSMAIKDLTSKVLKSFANTISILNSSCVDVDEVSQGSEESAGKYSSTLKDTTPRRGHKRRKSSHIRYVDSPNWVHDGYAWRKYGQKIILNSKYPRNYFRCTHKNEQGCQAMKHVQRMREAPSLYRTTYFGRHTCNSSRENPEVIYDDLSAQEYNSNIINFSNNDIIEKNDCVKILKTTTTVNQINPVLSSFTLPKYKFDYELPSMVDVIENQSSSQVKHEYDYKEPKIVDVIQNLSSSSKVKYECHYEEPQIVDVIQKSEMPTFGHVDYTYGMNFLPPIGQNIDIMTLESCF